ncbi:AAA family ATPase [Glycomyces paridis]|uniref:ATP-binding protein n=1 Tax=Glycomyces paridis TaxID=2126555 RepID=A0A4V4HPE5_9ACTN|nr:AAA family ATPase [Glycomyces paridis]THV29656.1 ATP-binding protein [Glycomyces paridis]
MAHIVKFEVDDLAANNRTIRKELDRHTNIFWGQNGCGKTSLLKILTSALANDTSQLETVPFSSAKVYIHLFDEAPLLVKSISKYASPEDARENVPLEDQTIREYLKDIKRTNSERPQKKGGLDLKLRWFSQFEGRSDIDVEKIIGSGYTRHSYLPVSRIGGSRSPYSDGPPSALLHRLARSGELDDSLLTEIFVFQINHVWERYTREALFSIRETQGEGLASILALLFGDAERKDIAPPEAVTAPKAFELVRNFLREQGIDLRVPESHFIKQFDSNESLQMVVAEVLDVTKKVDTALRPQKQFQAMIDSFYSGEKHVELPGRSDGHGSANSSIRVMDGETRLDLELLSSGEKQLLQMMLEVLAASSESILIDEPELSLHVDWQQRLVRTMRKLNPNCQLLLATHSPEIMADIEDEFLHEL